MLRSKGRATQSHFFFGRQLARLFFEHHRNIVANRVCQPAWAADQLLFALVKLKRALANRANQNIE